VRSDTPTPWVGPAQLFRLLESFPKGAKRGKVQEYFPDSPSVSARNFDPYPF